MRAEARVLRHDSELGRWELFLRAPEPRLRVFVGEYEGYVESGSPPPLRQQVPTARLPLIVNFGSHWTIGASADAATTAYGSFTAGLGERSSYVAAGGPASCVRVNLTPLGAHMFFGLPMHELANRIVPLEDVLPRGTRELPERLADATSWEDRFDLLDRTLAARLADGGSPPRTSSGRGRCSSELTARRRSAGSATGSDSRRHLATRFREQIELPPKTVARIMRFERAVGLLERRGVGLAELAFACGYYDQAHLNRDFREFASTSPLAFARRIVHDGGVVV